jgi:hypothetical protein
MTFFVVTSILGDSLEFLQRLFDLLVSVGETIDETSRQLYSIDFENNIFTNYLGYFRYVVGSTNYTLFTTVLLIAIGISLWKYVIQGFTYIKSFLPW